jgi:HNH endonuclease
MTRRKPQPNAFAQWLEKIDGERRVKALCKPCWELKYCPYGPLVEQFPIPPHGDERSCRIFGHICPVFHVAEPFTETKELRNIRRSISRSVQFRVLKRENQICRQCGQAVKDGDIHFDHIIPWSKGGPSDEHNVQLLCGACNRRKSNSFENEHLVKTFHDHVTPPVDAGILDALFCAVDFCHDFRAESGRIPASQDFADRLNKGRLTFAEERGAEVVRDLDSFFKGPRPSDLSAKLFKALRMRWGFDNGERHSFKTSADQFGLEHGSLLEADISLVNRLGWRVSLKKAQRTKWMRS